MFYDNDGIYRGGITDDMLDALDILAHHGTPHIGSQWHSGRYHWGEGKNAFQRNFKFLAQVEKLKREVDENGKPLFTEKQIAASMEMNTSELRKRISLARAENRAILVAEAKRLVDKYSDENGNLIRSRSSLAEQLGVPESTFRSLLDEGIEQRMTMNAKNAQILKDRVNEVDYVQVGAGTEFYLNNVSNHSLQNTLKMLENEGYTLHDIPVQQLGTGKITTVKVLAKPGVEWKEVMQNRDKIQMPVDIYADDSGRNMRTAKEYVSVDPRRISIAYDNQGGLDKDGVIEIRRGVPDLSLGNNRYAQVRILVNGDHYLKGMAMYSDDIPDGYDIRFNTNKPEGTPMLKTEGYKESVLKATKDDLENPFGANIKPDEKIVRGQLYYTSDDGKEHQSAINIVKEEGDVNEWNRTLSSQFLAKQPPTLAKQQLKMTYDIAKAEFDEIASYTNPTVKAKMLMDFAGACDYDSVHLAAAALPRQTNKFLLPLTEISDKEVYAPGYRTGDHVALIRFPHGDIREIPILTVNNDHKQGKNLIGDAIDAVGVSRKTREILSGADCDGDTVVVIPCDNVKIASAPQFEELKGFSDRMGDLYPAYEGMKAMTSQRKGNEMGKTTNLIMDMNVLGASDDEKVRALKHSMVVIDAEKHKLNYKLSEEENDIKGLKEKYQVGGASTLLTRSTSPIYIPERKEKPYSQMTPEEKERWKNGELIYVNTGRTKTVVDYPKSAMTKEERKAYDEGDFATKRQIEKTMREEGRAKVSRKVVEEEHKKGEIYDPWDLVSRDSQGNTTRIERIYAEYATQMKELAREARKLARAQIDIPRDPAMAKEYAREVESLEAKLAIARKNAPLERQAQLVATKRLQMILADNPELRDDKEHYKREKGRQLDAARKALGAKKLVIGSKENPLTDKEWEAIQKGAVSKTTLRGILANSDTRRIKELAMPRTKTGISSAKLARAKSYLAKGYPRSQIADMLDISEYQLIQAIGIENA